MIVPVVTINEKSPYEVKVVGQNDFLFYTCHGIKYNVGFFLRKDHPSHDEVIMQFNDYIDSLPAKLDEI